MFCEHAASQPTEVGTTMNSARSAGPEPRLIPVVEFSEENELISEKGAIKWEVFATEKGNSKFYIRASCSAQPASACTTGQCRGFSANVLRAVFTSTWLNSARMHAGRYICGAGS